MYRIRKQPGREEYCIYSKNGKLKYKTNRRDLARRKLKALLQEYWYENTKEMENPIITMFSEHIEKEYFTINMLIKIIKKKLHV